MDLDDFILAVLCLVDEAVPRGTEGRRPFRQRDRGQCWPIARC